MNQTTVINIIMKLIQSRAMQESDDTDRESSDTVLNDDPCYLIVDTELLKLF